MTTAKTISTPSCKHGPANLELIYFGCNVAERHAALRRALFNLFPVPLMRATFAKSSTTQRWRLRSITPIPVGQIPASHALYDRIMKGLRARVDAGKQFRPAG